MSHQPRTIANHPLEPYTLAPVSWRAPLLADVPSSGYPGFFPPSSASTGSIPNGAIANLPGQQQQAQSVQGSAPTVQGASTLLVNEDNLPEQTVKLGFVSKQVVQSELFSAHSLISAKLNTGHSLASLSRIVQRVLQRQHQPLSVPSAVPDGPATPTLLSAPVGSAASETASNSSTTTQGGAVKTGLYGSTDTKAVIPEPGAWSFKAPSKVVLNDRRREEWFADLSNPLVPLHKLSKNIPNAGPSGSSSSGINSSAATSPSASMGTQVAAGTGLYGGTGAKSDGKGMAGNAALTASDKNLDMLLNRNVPIARAVWFLQAVGAAEVTQLSKSRSASSTAFPPSLSYTIDFTSSLYNLFLRLLAEISLPLTHHLTSASSSGLGRAMSVKGRARNLLNEPKSKENWERKWKYAVELLERMSGKGCVDRRKWACLVLEGIRTAHPLALSWILDQLLPFALSDIQETGWMAKTLLETLLARLKEIEESPQYVAVKDETLLISLGDSLRESVRKIWTASEGHAGMLPILWRDATWKEKLKSCLKEDDQLWDAVEKRVDRLLYNVKRLFPERDNELELELESDTEDDPLFSKSRSASPQKGSSAHNGSHSRHHGKTIRSRTRVHSVACPTASVGIRTKTPEVGSGTGSYLTSAHGLAVAYLVSVLDSACEGVDHFDDTYNQYFQDGLQGEQQSGEDASRGAGKKTSKPMLASAEDRLCLLLEWSTTSERFGASRRYTALQLVRMYIEGPRPPSLPSSGQDSPKVPMAQITNEDETTHSAVDKMRSRKYRLRVLQAVVLDWIEDVSIDFSTDLMSASLPCESEEAEAAIHLVQLLVEEGFFDPAGFVQVLIAKGLRACAAEIDLTKRDEPFQLRILRALERAAMGSGLRYQVEKILGPGQALEAGPVQELQRKWENDLSGLFGQSDERATAEEVTLQGVNGTQHGAAEGVAVSASDTRHAIRTRLLPSIESALQAGTASCTPHDVIYMCKIFTNQTSDFASLSRFILLLLGSPSLTIACLHVVLDIFSLHLPIFLMLDGFTTDITHALYAVHRRKSDLGELGVVDLKLLGWLVKLSGMAPRSLMDEEMLQLAQDVQDQRDRMDDQQPEKLLFPESIADVVQRYLRAGSEDAGALREAAAAIWQSARRTAEGEGISAEAAIARHILDTAGGQTAFGLLSEAQLGTLAKLFSALYEIAPAGLDGELLAQMAKSSVGASSSNDLLVRLLASEALSLSGLLERYLLPRSEAAVAGHDSHSGDLMRDAMQLAQTLLLPTSRISDPVLLLALQARAAELFRDDWTFLSLVLPLLVSLLALEHRCADTAPSLAEDARRVRSGILYSEHCKIAFLRNLQDASAQLLHPESENREHQLICLDLLSELAHAVQLPSGSPPPAHSSMDSHKRLASSTGSVAGSRPQNGSIWHSALHKLDLQIYLRRLELAGKSSLPPHDGAAMDIDGVPEEGDSTGHGSFAERFLESSLAESGNAEGVEKDIDLRAFTGNGGMAKLAHAVITALSTHLESVAVSRSSSRTAIPRTRQLLSVLHQLLTRTSQSGDSSGSSPAFLISDADLTTRFLSALTSALEYGIQTGKSHFTSTLATGICLGTKAMNVWTGEAGQDALKAVVSALLNSLSGRERGEEEEEAEWRLDVVSYLLDHATAYTRQAILHPFQRRSPAPSLPSAPPLLRRLATLTNLGPVPSSVVLKSADGSEYIALAKPWETMQHLDAPSSTSASGPSASSGGLSLSTSRPPMTTRDFAAVNNASLDLHRFGAETVGLVPDYIDEKPEPSTSHPSTSADAKTTEQPSTAPSTSSSSKPEPKDGEPVLGSWQNFDSEIPSSRETLWARDFRRFATAHMEVPHAHHPPSHSGAHNTPSAEKGAEKGSGSEEGKRPALASRTSSHSHQVEGASGAAVSPKKQHSQSTGATVPSASSGPTNNANAGAGEKKVTTGAKKRKSAPEVVVEDASPPKKKKAVAPAAAIPDGGGKKGKKK